MSAPGIFRDDFGRRSFYFFLEAAGLHGSFFVLELVRIIFSLAE